jgi:hypothetical protein
MQGASQAIEDGTTLAITLSLAGKNNVPLGTRTWESIRYVKPFVPKNFCVISYRYQRVCDAQLMGKTTRDKWHGAKPGDSGESFELPMPEWLLAFDAEAHAYATYDGIARSIIEDGYHQPSLSGEELTEREYRRPRL